VRDGSDEALREIDLATLLVQLMALRTEPDDWHYEGPDSVRLRARPSLLRRALGNLMDNAERYGGAPYRVTVHGRSDGLHVSVEDHGPGVPDALLTQLGRPFLRGDPARGGAAGTGLGLSIVKRAAEVCNGSLQMENRAGGGFVATLVLPIATATATPA
jgi:two-component system osmolarity sensor histidine kinase EnvZ